VEVDWSAEAPCPALVTRTSAEILNRKGIPRVVDGRPILFVLGPAGVGKTSVARRILGDGRREVSVVALRAALVEAVRRRAWPEALLAQPALLLDDVDFLHGRYGALDLCGELLRARADAGLRTVLCQGKADQSVTLLYEQVALTSRATILLRFPVGRGRSRYVAARCQARGIPYVREAAVLEPWSYAGVEQVLDATVVRQKGGGRSAAR
jgi:hypothetical protein